MARFSFRDELPSLSVYPEPEKLRGSRGVPLLGETHVFAQDPDTFVSSRWRKFGGIFRSHIAGAPVAIAASYRAVMSLLFTSDACAPSHENDTYNDQDDESDIFDLDHEADGELRASSGYAEFLQGVYGTKQNVLLADTKQSRSQIQSLFGNALSETAIANYMPTICRIIQWHVGRLVQGVEHGEDQVDIYPWAKAMFDDVTAVLFLGEPINDTDDTSVVNAHVKNGNPQNGESINKSVTNGTTDNGFTDDTTTVNGSKNHEKLSEKSESTDRIEFSEIESDVSENVRYAHSLCSAEMRQWRSDQFKAVSSIPFSIDVPGFGKNGFARGVDARQSILRVLRTRIRECRSAIKKNTKDGTPRTVLEYVAMCTVQNCDDDTDGDQQLDDRNDEEEIIEMAAQHLFLLSSNVIPKSLSAVLTFLLLHIADATADGRITHRSEQCREDRLALELTLQETLRLHPPLMGGLRRVEELTVEEHDDENESWNPGRALSSLSASSWGSRRSHSRSNRPGIVIDNTHIPCGYRVWYSCRHANTDSQVYPSALIFDPRRWLSRVTRQYGSKMFATQTYRYSTPDISKHFVPKCPFGFHSNESVQANSTPGGGSDANTKQPEQNPLPVTFGAGDRGCPGKELAWAMLILCGEEVLSQFDVRRADGCPRVEHLPERSFPVLRPDGAALVRLDKACP